MSNGGGHRPFTGLAFSAGGLLVGNSAMRSGVLRGRGLCKSETQSRGAAQRWTMSAHPSRRDFLVSFGMAAASLAFANTAVPPAKAAGLLLLPLEEPAYNRYIFVRAGESKQDAQGIVFTNPVDKLSVSNGLTFRGMEQVARCAERLRNEFGHSTEDGDREIFVWADTSAKTMQTAEILLEQLGLRREHVIPEYSFLEARGMGALNGRSVDVLDSHVHENDLINASFRVQAGEDGTPHDSVEDVFVRMRQLLSKTETSYSGVDVVVVAPDSYTLAIAECALRNDDLRNYRKYSYNPGELREVQPTVISAAPRAFLALAPDRPQFPNTPVERRRGL